MKRREVLVGAVAVSSTLALPGISRAQNAALTRISILVMGPQGAGKTSLILRHINGRYRSGSVPEQLEPQSRRIDLGGRSLALDIIDQPPARRRARIADAVAGADVAILGFDLSSSNSLERVAEQSYDHLRGGGRGGRLPVILTGFKSDLTSLPSDPASITNRGWDVLDQAFSDLLIPEAPISKYAECSAMSGDGVDAVFRYAAMAALGLDFDAPNVIGDEEIDPAVQRARGGRPG